MLIDIITLFPKMFEGPLTESMVHRAQKRGIVKIKIHQLRDWAINNHGQVDPVKLLRTPTHRGFDRVDDRPYGGGAGMILRVDVADNALRGIKSQISNLKSQKLGVAFRLAGRQARPYVILPTPSGKKFDQAMARKLVKKKHLVFLCPHYEGYDKRIESLVNEKISIGDYVLTGGEIPVIAMVDAVVRLVPGVINKDSLEEESFNAKYQISNVKSTSKSKCQKIGNWKLEIGNFNKLEYPQYTRPEVFEMKVKNRKVKKRVPKVLLSGNHALIAKWRKNS